MKKLLLAGEIVLTSGAFAAYLDSTSRNNNFETVRNTSSSYNIGNDYNSDFEKENRKFSEKNNINYDETAREEIHGNLAIFKDEGIKKRNGFSKIERKIFQADRQSVILPSYNYPDDHRTGDQYWSTVTSIGGSQIPYVIVNPSNGPGKRTDSNYVKQISDNMNAGIKNIGYIKTEYQRRSVAEVMADVDQYYNLYGQNNINGFFFDEVGVDYSNQPGYMKTIYDYAKSKSPDTFVIGNPGRQINDGLAPYADVFVTSEISADEYINRFSAPKSSFENNSANAQHIMHIVYAARPEQYDEIIRLSRERNAGWLMITDDIQPNPYDGLPTDFRRMVAVINNLNGTVPPTIGGGSRNNGSRATGNGNSTALGNSAKPKIELEIPRSKVDLDLMKNSRSSIYRSMENSSSKGMNLNAVYIGNFGTDYKDKGSNVNYSSTSNGILISAMKNFDKFSLGGGFGYQKSKVKYKREFDGIEEKIDSYQFILNGKYNFNENIDLMGVMTYSANKHKFKNQDRRVFMQDAQYNSTIWDFDTRLGYKYRGEKGYLKPYVGVGITSVHEGEITKINAGKSSETSVNGVLGVYGQIELGKFDLFGNVEYERKLSGNSYHGKRDYGTGYEMKALKYSKSAINLGIGAKYKISSSSNIGLEYEMLNTKNGAFKLSYSLEK